MKLVKAIACLATLLTATTSFAAVIPAGGYGVNSNFIDNGVVTTEYRDDGTVWEWLDLTVTNGISNRSVVADLEDDGILNNSTALNGSVGAIADVTALSAQQNSGWQTVAMADAVSMLNSYFGTSFSVGSNLFALAAPLNEASTVELFINLFGDTYHDGFADDNLVPVDANPSLANIGYAYGISSTAISATYNRETQVFDGQFIDETVDANGDEIKTSEDRFVVNPAPDAGTWLVRQVVVVSEPSTVLLFALTLIGFAAARTQRS